MAVWDAWITLGTTTDVGNNSATINGTYGPDSNDYNIQSPITLFYGIVSSPTPNVSVTISGGSFSKILSGLAPNTLYYVYARGWNGIKYSYSPEITFTTTDTNRYWVGGSGNWDTSTTHWSNSSGGAGGATAPTSIMNVIFDEHSNESGDTAYTVSTSQNSTCLDWNAGFTGTTKVTFSGSSGPSVYGNINLTAGQVSFSYSGAYVTMKATSGTKTITTNGIDFTGLNLDGVGGTFQLADDLYTSGSIILTNGTLDPNGKTVILDGIGTTHAIYGSPTFYNLTIGGTNGSMVSLFSDIIITNLFSITNTHSVLIYTDDSITYSQRTITSDSNSLRNVSFLGIIGSGDASWDLADITGGSGDAGYNSGIIFTAPTTQHWTNVNGGYWYTVSNWTSRVPLPQDTIIMDCAFGESKTVTGSGWYYVGDIDWSGATFTTALTWTTLSVKFIGSIKLKDGMTLTDGFELIGDNLCLLTTAGVILPKYINCRKPNGILKLGDALTMASGTSEGISIISGTFDTDSYNITTEKILSSISLETDLSTFYFRDSVITITGSGYGNSVYWINEGDTIDAGTSTLKFTGTGNNQLILGGHHYNIVWIDKGVDSGLTILTHNNYFNEFRDTSLVGGALQFVDGCTNYFKKLTISGEIGNMRVISNTGGSGGANTNFVFDGVGTISNVDYLSVSYIDASPTETWYIGSNSVEGTADTTTGFYFNSLFTQNIADTVAISDNISMASEFNTEVNDSISISDNASAGFIKNIDDTISLTDSISARRQTEDVWKTIVAMKINIGGQWTDLF